MVGQSPSASRRRRRRVGPRDLTTNHDADDDADEDSVAAVNHQPPPRADPVNYKHVANVPLTSFDRFLVDSDADTVTSQDVRRQFRAALTSVPRGWL